MRAAGRRLILDSVSAFGALPFSLADHPECDAVVFTSGKCLEGMPGIGFAVARIDRVEAAAGNAGSWAFDLADVYSPCAARRLGQLPLHAAGAGAGAPSRSRSTCTRREGGQPARLARYAENARVLYEGVLALGLTPYLERAPPGPGDRHRPPAGAIRASPCSASWTR